MSDRVCVWLERASAVRFRWGRRDCLLWMADWVLHERGVDPAGDLRGRYRTRCEALDLIAAEGGLVAMVARRAAAAGLAETDAPLAGDIGLVQAPTEWGMELAGAVCTGRRWAMLGVRGLISLPSAPVKAWSI